MRTNFTSWPPLTNRTSHFTCWLRHRLSNGQLLPISSLLTTPPPARLSLQLKRNEGSLPPRRPSPRGHRFREEAERAGAERTATPSWAPKHPTRIHLLSMHTCTRMCTRVCVHTCAHVCVHVYSHADTYGHVHTYARTQYTHVHTYTRVPAAPQLTELPCDSPVSHLDQELPEGRDRISFSVFPMPGIRQAPVHVW